MPFQIIQGNILDTRCEAIVNPTDERFSGSGGLDAQIHAAAGPELAAECASIGLTGVGQALVTQSYDLACRYIIHTVAPWYTGREQELESLRDCYRRALGLARQWGVERLALPLIGAGTRGFPPERVLAIATEEIQRFLADGTEMEILLVVHDRRAFRPEQALLDGVAAYIRRTMRSNYLQSLRDENEEEAFFSAPMAGMPTSAPKARRRPFGNLPSLGKGKKESQKPAPPADAPAEREDTESFTALYSAVPDEVLMDTCSAFQPGRETVLDESFSQMVLRKIDERGYKKDSECYCKANITKQHFSKIRCDVAYHPKKTTALALAVALELTLEETKELLMKAGYSLSHSILLDVIVEYCILQGYNIFEINELLFQYDQPLLGT